MYAIEDIKQHWGVEECEEKGGYHIALLYSFPAHDSADCMV